MVMDFCNNQTQPICKCGSGMIRISILKFSWFFNLIAKHGTYPPKYMHDIHAKIQDAKQINILEVHKSIHEASPLLFLCRNGISSNIEECDFRKTHQQLRNLCDEINISTRMRINNKILIGKTGYAR